MDCSLTVYYVKCTKSVQCTISMHRCSHWKCTLYFYCICTVYHCVHWQCTLLVHCTCIVDQWVYLQFTMHVHRERLSALTVYAGSAFLCNKNISRKFQESCNAQHCGKWHIAVLLNFPAQNWPMQTTYREFSDGHTYWSDSEGMCFIYLSATISITRTLPRPLLHFFFLLPSPLFFPSSIW